MRRTVVSLRAKRSNLLRDCFVALLLAMTPITPAHADIKDGLVGQWTFDGVDDSVTTNVNPSTAFKGGFTLSFWTYIQSKAQGSFYSAADSNANRFYFRTTASTASLTLGLSSWNPTLNNAYTLNQWEHYVVVLDGTTGYVYHNGELILSQAGITVSLPNQILRIGSGISGTMVLNGLLDDFRIYNRALNAQEITELYQPPVDLGEDVIPSNRLPPFGAWTKAGVPGGIPTNRTHLIDVTQSPYNADKTGNLSASTAINSAIAAALPGDVVKLPAGTYLIDNPINILKSNITLRGEGDATILHTVGSWQGKIQAGLASNWMTALALSGNYSAGDAILHVPNAAGYAVGDMVRVRLDNNSALPVVSVLGATKLQSQLSRVTATTTNTISIDPPLMFNIESSFNPEIHRNPNYRVGIGIEDLKIDATARTGAYTIQFSSLMDSWIKNVTSYNSSGVHFYLVNALQTEIRHSRIEESQTHGPNNAGIKTDPAWFTLIEDNIFIRLFPAVQLNGNPNLTSGGGGGGNVVAYNFSYNSFADSKLAGPTYSTHGPHEMYDLYEGNIGEKLQQDGYFGSASDVTLLRNWFQGAGPENKINFRAIDLCRFSRNYNIVGNLLGKEGHAFTLDAGETLPYLPYETAYIYRLGYPNVDNGVWVGTAEPSTGDNWADWGTNPGPSGFKEIDRDVRNTTLLQGNWNSVDRGIHSTEALNGKAIPSSLYLKGKPSWFGNLAWPPFNPLSPNMTYEAIPAGYRFVHGNNSLPTDTTAPVTTGKTLTVMKYGTGQGTITGTGIDCGSDCTEMLAVNSRINITPKASEGSVFAGWRREVCSSISVGENCNIPMNADQTAAAIFGKPATRNGKTLTAASCDMGDVQVAINQALDGDTIEVPASTTMPGGVCTWPYSVMVDAKTIPRALIIKGQTTVDALKGESIDRTIIVDEVPIKNQNGPLFSMNTTEGKSLRLTGFTFKTSPNITGVKSGAGIEIYGTSKAFRIDHNKIELAINGRAISARGYIFGVIDHNIFNNTTGQAITIYGDAWGPGASTCPTFNTYGCGDASWASPLSLGTEQATYIENNLFRSRIVTDAYSGARFVVRYNQIETAMAPIQDHGTDSEGRYRGTFSWEAYNNTVKLPSSVNGMIFKRSGTGVIFNNTVTAGTSAKTLGNLMNYRSNDPFQMWGVCDGSNPWDKNDLSDGSETPGGAGDGVFEAGVHHGVNVTTGVLTDSNKNWTADRWVGYSLRNMTKNWGAQISGNTANTISVTGSAFNRVRNWDAGDSYEIRRVDACFDQIGRSAGDLISGGNSPTPVGWPNQTLEPVYAWNNTINGTANDKLSSGAYVIKKDRDYYEGVTRPGYVPYIYPHPLTVSGFTADDPDAPDLPMPGSSDVSGDGKVTMYDAALVLRFTLGSNLTDAQKTVADKNGDGKIDGADVVAIARKALGL